MDDITTLRILKTDRERLDKLCKRDGFTYLKEYFEAMINYFEETGLNPEEKVKSVSGELKNLRNTVVSFTRKQEQTKLDPLMKNVDELTQTLLTFLKTEAVRKDDLKEFVRLSQNQPKPVLEQKSSPKAKDLFQEFVGKMNSKIGGSYSIDKKTLSHYQNLFNGL